MTNPSKTKFSGRSRLNYILCEEVAGRVNFLSGAETFAAPSFLVYDIQHRQQACEQNALSNTVNNRPVMIVLKQTIREKANI